MAHSRLKRSVPYLESLIHAKRRRPSMLRAFPNFVLDDIAEILLNIVRGNVKTPPKLLPVLKRCKQTLLKVAASASPKTRRQIIYKQSGGFLPALLPVLATIAAGLLL